MPEPRCQQQSVLTDVRPRTLEEFEDLWDSPSSTMSRLCSENPAPFSTSVISRSRFAADSSSSFR